MVVKGDRRAYQRAYLKKWYEEHPDYLKKWHEEHPNYLKKWHEEHPNYNTEYSRIWRMRNREKIAESKRLLRMIRKLKPQEFKDAVGYIEDLSKKEVAKT
jgi:preprotein translocase subunit Sss1